MYTENINPYLLGSVFGDGVLPWWWHFTTSSGNFCTEWNRKLLLAFTNVAIWNFLFPTCMRHMSVYIKCFTFTTRHFWSKEGVVSCPVSTSMVKQARQCCWNTAAAGEQAASVKLLQKLFHLFFCFLICDCFQLKYVSGIFNKSS